MRSHRRHWSILKILKLGIALAPVTGAAVGSYNAAGGGSRGFTSALGTVSTAYTGYDPVTGTFAPANMAIGYIPLFGAWLFGKIASRVLRM